MWRIPSGGSGVGRNRGREGLCVGTRVCGDFVGPAGRDRRREHRTRGGRPPSRRLTPRVRRRPVTRSPASRPSLRPYTSVQEWTRAWRGRGEERRRIGTAGPTKRRGGGTPPTPVRRARRLRRLSGGPTLGPPGPRAVLGCTNHLGLVGSLRPSVEVTVAAVAAPPTPSEVATLFMYV